MLLRCGSRMVGAATTMGGVALLAGLAPFLAGLGVGAAVMGGACMARDAMRKRTAWRDDPLSGSAGPSGRTEMPDEGDAAAGAAPI